MSKRTFYTVLGITLVLISTIGLSYVFYFSSRDRVIEEEVLRIEDVSYLGDFDDNKFEVSNNELDSRFITNDASNVQDQTDELAISNSRALPDKIAEQKQNKIVIPKIGVNTDVLFASTSDPESALEFGAWIVNDFSVPSYNYLVDSAKPVIIASHLYGYEYWSEEFRNRVSFKGLDNLMDGDLIKVYWENRLYKYEVIDGEVDTKINKYDSDLILYTCNDLTGSDLRVIRYANLIN